MFTQSCDEIVLLRFRLVPKFQLKILCNVDSLFNMLLDKQAMKNSVMKHCGQVPELNFPLKFLNCWNIRLKYEINWKIFSTYVQLIDICFTSKINKLQLV